MALVTEFDLWLWLHRRGSTAVIRCAYCSHHSYATHRDKASDMAYRHRRKAHRV
jgi:hypothetical protein